MGSCLGKEHTGSSMSLPNDEARQPPIDDDVDAISSDNPHPESTSGPCRPVLVVSRAKIDSLVLENLSVIRTLFDYDQEPPSSMMQLHFIADQEDGWLQVVQSMIDVIPMQDALGPANITLLLDDCPLPSKETVIRLTQVLDLSRATSIQGRSCPNRHRNICIVLGCMAETLAGPRCLDFFTDSTLDYLLANLDECVSPDVILFALIALEKFAQTSENKVTICKRLLADSSRSYCNPLVKLEKWRDLKNDWFRRQVGFCAQWCLDNLFVLADRPLSYTIVDMSHINAVLNSNDVSEYLKISPEGLEARCDAASFESVRCTFQVDAGAWYYEVIVVTGGVMQIGWATKDSKFLNYEGYGIGDDEFSLAYDGCRQWMWHNAVSHSQEHLVPRWQPGDVVGCLLDLDQKQIIFSLNGVALPAFNQVFKQVQSGFFAAASFMSFQQCIFNFGASAFCFPPQNANFLSFNDYSILSPNEKVILPRRLKLEYLKKQIVKEDACTLCFDSQACSLLDPCHHGGFCERCAAQLETCPMCRAPINAVIKKM